MIILFLMDVWDMLIAWWRDRPTNRVQLHARHRPQRKLMQVTDRRPGRIPLGAARQYALEMEGARYTTGDDPVEIGGVRTYCACVKVYPAVEMDGLRVSLEVRALSVVYPDNHTEQYEFDAAGRLLYHVEPYET